MVVCMFDRLGEDIPGLKNLGKARECLGELAKQGYPAGRYEFDGGFLFVQRGTTKAFGASDFEVHRDYIDVQYMLQGREQILYAPLSDLKMEQEYKKDADIEFLSLEKNQYSVLSMSDGMCCVLYPEDGHMPCRHLDEPSEYLKIVVKLPWRRQTGER